MASGNPDIAARCARRRWPAALLLLMAAASSCVGDDQEPCTPTDRLRLSLSIHTASSPASRAITWHPYNDYERVVGNAFENAIDVDNTQVLLYAADDNRFLAQVNSFDCYVAAGDGATYTLVGDLAVGDDFYASGSYKVVVCTNFTQLPTDAITAAGLEALTYDRDALKYIPMWGVTTQTLTLAPGELTELGGEVYLLRAMAKVVVRLSDALVAQRYTIDRGEIAPCNLTGYCLPAGAMAYANTTDLPLGAAADINAGCHHFIAPQQGATVAAEGAAQALVFYLPEYDNNGSDPEPKVGITLKQGNNTLDFPGGILLREYDANSMPTERRFDLLRNHVYTYEITGFSDSGDRLYFHTLIRDWLPTDPVEIDYYDLQ